MDKKLPRSVSRRNMEPCSIKAVGVWFLSKSTGRYLYLLRNDPKHPNTWGLPGGKVELGETLLDAMVRECVEELGHFPNHTRLMPLEKFTSSDNVFEYNTWLCVVGHEFVPVLNNEHLGYAWIDKLHQPKPMHPGLWSTVNIDAVKDKLLSVESNEIEHL